MDATLELVTLPLSLDTFWSRIWMVAPLLYELNIGKTYHLTSLSRPFLVEDIFIVACWLLELKLHAQRPLHWGNQIGLVGLNAKLD